MANIAEGLESLTISISSIKPDPRNARKHLERNIEAIKRSLEQYGQRKPIVVRKATMHVEAGNGMLQAAKALSWTEIAAVLIDDDEDTAKAFGLMDNQSALLAEWDLPTLKDLLTELDTGAFDMDLTGFDTKEIEDLMNQTLEPTEGLTDDDAIPEQVETICKKGDLWKLGEHRLLCGDSTVITDVERLMGGDKIGLLATDPPYGINIVHVDGATDGGSKPFGSVKPGARGFGSWGTVQKGPKSKNKLIKANVYHTIEGDDKPFNPTHLIGIADHTVLWGANYYADKLPSSAGWICWDKREQITRNSFADCELAWTSDHKPSRVFSHLWNGLHKGSEHGDRRLHPTQKPVALFEWLIEQYTEESDIVADLYGGSGSTLIACEKLQRKCRMMEIDEHYCDVIITRWQDFTGKKAELING